MLARQPFRTIRARLTLWYVVLLGVILLVFSVALYLSLAFALYAEFDSSLRVQASQALAEVELQRGEPHFSEELISPPGTIPFLYDLKGRRVGLAPPNATVPFTAAVSE